MNDQLHNDLPLNERLLDVLVFGPAGLVLSLAQELPRWVERGRGVLGARVSSARVVGQFTVQMAQRKLKHRLGSMQGGVRSATDRVVDGQRADPTPEDGPEPVRTSGIRPPGGVQTKGHRPSSGYVPPSSMLAIPGFDTLSASQVVHRLDGLTRGQLIAVRAYESAVRRRRTILGRVDQLLDERS